MNRRKLITALIISTFQATFADIVAQVSTKHSTHFSDIKWKRTAVFATFGFMYLGAVQYIIYVKFLNRAMQKIVNPSRVYLDRVLKIGTVESIITPFVYYPTFFFIQDQIQQSNKNSKNRLCSFYRMPTMDDLCNAWKLWIPAHIVTFSVPRHWRLPWITSVSFLWNIILSYRTNKVIVQ
eukprot:301854_1